MKNHFVLIALIFIIPDLLLAGSPPSTLLDMAGVQPTPTPLSESVVVVIDGQREYVDGALPLVGVDRAMAEGAHLLTRARKSGAPVIHVVHRGGGALFNPQTPYFSIAEPLTPVDGEVVIEKRLPNAFSGTKLQATIEATGHKQLIVVGFMTHMCVSSTVRAALDLGYATTLIADATATRDLPDVNSGVIPARVVQQVTLASLADRFAVVVKRVDDLPE
jgi:nicotinamidase-related amidase